MSQMIQWLEAHDKLAGWAQFLGAMLALLLTYLTAFAPLWRRKRQLCRAATRLLSNGYEAIESYHRTSAHFLPFPLSIRVAAMTMMAEEIDRFPIFELDDQKTIRLFVGERLEVVTAMLRGDELKRLEWPVPEGARN